jgi:hypothetical protein
MAEGATVACTRRVKQQRNRDESSGDDIRYECTTGGQWGGGGHPSGAARRGTKARPAGGSRADDEGRQGRGAGGAKGGMEEEMRSTGHGGGTAQSLCAVRLPGARQGPRQYTGGGVRMGPVRRQGARPRQRRQRGPEKPQGGRGGPQAWPRRCAWDEEGGCPIVNTRAGKRSGKRMGVSGNWKRSMRFTGEPDDGADHSPGAARGDSGRQGWIRSGGIGHRVHANGTIGG